MRTRPILVAITVLALLASGIGASSPAGPAPQPATGSQIEYDSTLLRVDVGADSDAAWTIEYRVAFDGSNETEQAFEELRRDIQANRSEFESQFAARMNRTASSAENATGRQMRIENVSVEAETQVTAGVVRYTFEWTNFTRTTADRILVGDAIAGLVLDSDTTLTISWPERFGVLEIQPDDANERRGGIAIWYGQKTFAPDEPAIVLAEDTPTPTATASASGPGGTVSPTATDEGPATGGGLDPLLVGLVLLVLIGLAVVGYLWRTGRIGGTGPVSPATEPDDAGGGAAAAATGGGAGEDDGAPPEDLLSNEERVLQLLEDNGGRMKQQQVVAELGWTDAKTSQVVGTLRDEEKIEAFRIGRENVLALPGETDF